ncbi:MAG: hypothetical protein AABX16_03180 [Nanoarchaeota archaeon]
MNKIEIKKSIKKEDVNQLLVENFVQLQKVLTNLSIKFDELSSNINRLLQLFELSAKSFADNNLAGKSGSIDNEFLKKLDALLDQNKVISKGIMLMEEKIKGKIEQSPKEMPRDMMRSRQFLK